MKIAIVMMSLVVPCTVSFSQEPQRPAAPARPETREGAQARPVKPAPEFLQSPEWAQLVEALIEKCHGNLRCVVDMLQIVLNDPKASPASKDAANHLMVRAKNALEAQAALKDKPEESERMNAGMRERLVKARMAAAHDEGERLRAAARKEVEAGRLTEEGLRERMAQAEAARKALGERLNRGVAPRNDRAPAPPRPTGGGGSRG